MPEKQPADYHLVVPERLEHEARKELVRQRRACAAVAKENERLRELGPKPVDEA